MGTNSIGPNLYQENWGKKWTGRWEITNNQQSGMLTGESGCWCKRRMLQKL